MGGTTANAGGASSGGSGNATSGGTNSSRSNIGGSDTGGSSAGGNGAAGGNDAGGATTAGSSAVGAAGNSSTDVGISYRVNPPHPCYDQQTNQACFNGTDTTCSTLLNGKCTVANVCEDDASKVGQPVLFACPRDMLFSQEMVQAAKDDAATYGWSSAADPPFNYAVVGHDSDGDLDGGTPDTCCQCYQLVLGRPLDDAPQPPEIPLPKPLIVQTFNTAAGGGKNFDVFMAVGGYGAFNGCYDDPNFQNTKRMYGEFAYTGFPDPTALSGGANMFYYEGGLRYKNLSVCSSSDWPPTADAVKSEACQDRVETLCNQIESPSANVTATSRNSCIQANKVESLYHQNWQEVRAKRVECPESLTRVTGCRLKDQGLPKPNPAVQSAADADPSFKSGYTITTMQDCCMPTCAWKENVKSPVEGAWRSFYSCRANGEPITAD